MAASSALTTRFQRGNLSLAPVQSLLKLKASMPYCSGSEPEKSEIRLNFKSVFHTSMGVVFNTVLRALKNSGCPTMTESIFFTPEVVRKLVQSIVEESLGRSEIAILL